MDALAGDVAKKKMISPMPMHNRISQQAWQRGECVRLKEEHSWSHIRNGSWLDIFVVGKAQNTFHHSLCNAVGMFCEDLPVKVEEAGFDDRGDGAWIDLTEGMIFAHVSGDAACVKVHFGHALIAIHQAGGETIGAVEIIRVERRSDFKAGGFDR